MIARVFPRKTAASPTDPLAFFGAPTIENIADCIKAGIEAVHISVTFTWDLERAEELYDAWQILGVPVEVGGPAFDDRMGSFTPGLYLREGMIFTSRGCTKECWFCSVPRCAHGEIRELYPITITMINFHLSNTLRATIISAKNYRDETIKILASELGKTAFLSLEEAERALEELKNV